MMRLGALVLLLRLASAVELSFSSSSISFSEVETTTRSDGEAAFRKTYVSSRLGLRPGEVILTDPAVTPLTMPTSPFWLRGLRVEVVDDKGSSVPLTEVYLHHVAFYDGSKGADVCGGANLDSRDALWSVGAESRGTRTFFPEGFGYNATGPWSANIHLIRTDGVKDVKSCVECRCPGFVGGGSEACCPDGTRCDLVDGEDPDEEKGYSLKYEVTYESMDAKNAPLAYRTLDVASCQLEFNVPAACPWSFRHSGTTAGAVALVGSGRFFPYDFLLDDDLPDHCVATRSWSMVWNEDDGRLVFGKMHMHIGAIDGSLYVERRRAAHNRDDVVVVRDDGPGPNLRGEGGGIKRTEAPEERKELLCRVEPTYGTEMNVPGDELGYVVGISNCDAYFADDTMPVIRRGDVLTVEARYRAQPHYDGVMGLFDIAVAPLSA